MSQLSWLPTIPNWRKRVNALPTHRAPWDEAIALANANLDFAATNRLSHVAHQLFSSPPESLESQPVRLALLGSSNLTQLHAAVRVGGLRRGLHISTYECEFGQYHQCLSDPHSDLHTFRPTAVLLAFDAYHLTEGASPTLTAAEADGTLEFTKARISETWRLASASFNCPVIQQTILPVHVPLLGNNEQRIPGSRASLVSRLNESLREMADRAGVDLLAVDAYATRDGVAQWHDPTLWHYAKQEIAATAVPLYGDLVARIVAAKQGRSAKCLVLDLDNTLWGGVVSEAGLEGIVIGPGTALGEAFASFQHYCRDLAARGVILAICSKNDEVDAMAPFERRTEMTLRRGDFASFVANWLDKATNLRVIAEEIGIGLDSLVFVDDNPFERNLIRRELPMVAVPELDEDPSTYAGTIAAAGYFEALSFTDEDRKRTSYYRATLPRGTSELPAVDLESYLRELDMKLVWRRFDRAGLVRITQLINKTNRFNLTSRRYTECEVIDMMSDPGLIALQLRLKDRLCDNGVIAIIIGRLQGTDNLLIDTWLMSCRVLGRQVEAATLNLIASEAKKLAIRQLIGQYVPTPRNGMVREHFQSLGFALADVDSTGLVQFALDLDQFSPLQTNIQIAAGIDDAG